MTQTTTQTPQPQDPAGAEIDAVDEQVAARLVEQAREQCATWSDASGVAVEQVGAIAARCRPGPTTERGLEWVTKKAEG
jgi:hypothetical protein